VGVTRGFEDFFGEVGGGGAEEPGTGTLDTMHTDVVLLFLLVGVAGVSGRTRPEGRDVRSVREEEEEEEEEEERAG